ncbi:hypothetical protein PtB15_8B288 [Puccinia triticina]|nr:hypothetical protein PtB15_8B288 [Puccinia triticina]
MSMQPKTREKAFLLVSGCNRHSKEKVALLLSGHMGLGSISSTHGVAKSKRRHTDSTERCFSLAVGRRPMDPSSPGLRKLSAKKACPNAESLQVLRRPPFVVLDEVIGWDPTHDERPSGRPYNPHLPPIACSPVCTL